MQIIKYLNDEVFYDVYYTRNVLNERIHLTKVITTFFKLNATYFERL